MMVVTARFLFYSLYILFTNMYQYMYFYHMDGLVQERRNSIANCVGLCDWITNMFEWKDEWWLWPQDSYFLHFIFSLFILFTNI